MRILVSCFFFSSRRRHTRWTGDWSSDVCSSDLHDLRLHVFVAEAALVADREAERLVLRDLPRADVRRHDHDRVAEVDRSEERRVGKEWRARWWPHHVEKKEKGGPAKQWQLRTCT